MVKFVYFVILLDSCARRLSIDALTINRLFCFYINDWPSLEALLIYVYFSLSV